MAANLCILPVSAQISSNPNKFLGNITTDWPGSMDYDGLKYSDYWNQVTPENGTKWGTVEGTRGSYYWDGSDPAFNYAKNHGFQFKFHTLIWGSQFPSWFKNLSLSERYGAIKNWMDVVKKKYPNLHMIDVANEAVEGHQPDTPIIKAALAGGGKTGYDWLIKAFEMAYERWPDAILIYNDFNTFSWQINEYIELVKTLRDAGAPIDAYGNQSHDLGGKTASELQSVMKKQQDALKMPMYISEYDIQDADDANQKWNYQQHIPLMWEAEYCAGVTLWGWIYGHTWMENISGIVKNKQERSALKWLREYMQTDAAKNAISPFPGNKKEASIYIRPAALKIAKGDVLPIKIHARLATKTIQKVDFYVNDELVETMTEAPYIVDYNASETGEKTAKAVVTATDGSTYERYGAFTVSKGKKRSPYNETVPKIPGVLNVTEYDNGISGVTYNDASRSISPTKDGQWMEYTVDVQEEGYYTMIAEVASTNAGGTFHLSEYTLDNITFFTDFTEVPNTGGTDQYQSLQCPMKEYLTAGRHVFCLNIDKGGFYIKSLTFKHTPTFVLPGVVEAEDYYQGGDGMSIINGNGGSVLSNIGTDVFAEYSINIATAGKYSYEATVSSAVDDTKFSIGILQEDGSVKRLVSIPVPNTGSLENYTVKSGKIKNAIKVDGQQTLRFSVESGKCNIDNVKFICTEPTSGINEVMSDDTSDAPAYNLMGVPVNAGYRGIVIKNGKKVVIK
jgi:GH35 family endo-1,4-beta-xylanase